MLNRFSFSSFAFICFIYLRTHYIADERINQVRVKMIFEKFSTPTVDSLTNACPVLKLVIIKLTFDEFV